MIAWGTNVTEIDLNLLHGVERSVTLAASSLVSGFWQGIVLAAGGMDLFAADAEDDSCDPVCGLDGGVCGSCGVAAVACVWIAGGRRSVCAWALLQVDVRWSFAIAALWLVGLAGAGGEARDRARRNCAGYGSGRRRLR